MEIETANTASPTCRSSPYVQKWDGVRTRSSVSRNGTPNYFVL
jgi:hypothetical protein